MGWIGLRGETDLAFDVTNDAVDYGRAPEAEVIDAVDDSSLAERIWASGLGDG